MTDPSASYASRSCSPCRGGVPPLSAEDAECHRIQTPRWALRDESTRIERHFKFKTFAKAFAFVERVAHLAEAEGHHPDVSFGWGYATISLKTHIIKGLSDNDFIVAAKLDRLVESETGTPA